MIHNIQLIKKERQQVNRWAGGTTAQLAIYPEAASYADRSFTWRLSSAVVELEKSVFTSLPGFDRILMVLEGELKLVHEGQHTAHLKLYQQDSFKGGWNTVSYGKARDFNLMIKEGLKGSLMHFNIAYSQSIKEHNNLDKDEEGFYACFCCSGMLEISVDYKTILLKEGELLLINYTERVDLVIKGYSKSASNMIIAQISGIYDNLL